jgi:hypothetical protein
MKEFTASANFASDTGPFSARVRETHTNKRHAIRRTKELVKSAGAGARGETRMELAGKSYLLYQFVGVQKSPAHAVRVRVLEL